MKIGFVVAMDKEYEPFLDRLGDLVASETRCGMEFCVYVSSVGEVVLAKCGIGEIAATSAVSLLIGYYGCGYILNFGLVGALDSTLLERKLVCVESVVHYDSDLTSFGHPLGAANDQTDPFLFSDKMILSLLLLRGIPCVRLASGDSFIAGTDRKNKLISDFSAQICDMEGAGIALTSVRSGVPFTMIKVISDSADENAVETFTSNKLSGLTFAIDTVLQTISELYFDRRK